MDFQDIVTGRRMVRSYTADPVDAAAIDRMLQNAVRAPNAGFTQGWAFLVLDTPADLDRFWGSTSPGGRAAGSSRWLTGMRSAPVVIVPLSSKEQYVRRYAEPDKGWSDAEEPRWGVPYWHVDAGMASLLVLQTAVDEGLGGCFFGIPREQVPAFRAEFGIPGEYAPVGAITIGHPDPHKAPGGSPTRRARKHVDDVVHRGGWRRRGTGLHPDGKIYS
ncbi:nitroreductase family protein [Microterricola pindariensis]|uniref:Nitroreductase n=1 Tax=Microterricola pindariensis TaxID=478010 RepID=A0ABX5AZZ4_9MICO|nr:nitroreductase family protein [Microterricola pindariensis]PPL20478.1 nitroreductase [Microterricola pindariensis]